MNTDDIELFAAETDIGYGKMHESYYVLGVGGEAGEILELHKKNLRTQGVENFKEKLAGEIGDIMWYLARLANHNGLTLEECWLITREKLIKRHEDGYYG
ncbi:MAG: nucleoside triphosphate pyrophosphohydrolase family protein [Candidatus Thorarchaeota archaeon]|jgi:NTP pyrophosphatase (non-canonical NTP hydrolase)